MFDQGQHGSDNRQGEDDHRDQELDEGEPPFGPFTASI
jgi:hypothetical protein